jgi:hypothetical protein
MTLQRGPFSQPSPTHSTTQADQKGSALAHSALLPPLATATAKSLFVLFAPSFFTVLPSLLTFLWLRLQKRQRLFTAQSSHSFFRKPAAFPDGIILLSLFRILSSTMTNFSTLFGLIASSFFFYGILADSIVTQSNGLLFSYSTSGTEVKTFVLQTAVVTTCTPCSTVGTVTPMPSVQIQTTSSGTSIRPQLCLIAGAFTVLSGLVLILAWWIDGLMEWDWRKASFLCLSPFILFLCLYFCGP